MSWPPTIEACDEARRPDRHEDNGRVPVDDDGRVSFTYDEAWRNDPATFPLSLSMPKTAVRYGGGVVSNWLWKLLSESDHLLQRIEAGPAHHSGRTCGPGRKRVT
jgi:HipA-like protein